MLGTLAAARLPPPPLPHSIPSPPPLNPVHFMLYKYWFPPLNDFAIIERSAANIKETSRMLAKAALGG